MSEKANYMIFCHFCKENECTGLLPTATSRPSPDLICITCHNQQHLSGNGCETDDF